MRWTSSCHQYAVRSQRPRRERRAVQCTAEDQFERGRTRDRRIEWRQAMLDFAQRQTVSTSSQDLRPARIAAFASARGKVAQHRESVSTQYLGIVELVRVQCPQHHRMHSAPRLESRKRLHSLCGRSRLARTQCDEHPLLPFFKNPEVHRPRRPRIQNSNRPFAVRPHPRVCLQAQPEIKGVQAIQRQRAVDLWTEDVEPMRPKRTCIVVDSASEAWCDHGHSGRFCSFSTKATRWQIFSHPAGAPRAPAFRNYRLRIKRYI